MQESSESENSEEEDEEETNGEEEGEDDDDEERTNEEIEYGATDIEISDEELFLNNNFTPLDPLPVPDGIINFAAAPVINTTHEVNERDTEAAENGFVPNHEQNDEGDVPDDPKLLLYVSFVLSCRLSERDQQRMDILMQILCGRKPIFNAKDVEKYIETKKRSIIKKNLVHCRSCGNQKLNSKCLNHHCEKYRLPYNILNDSTSCELNIETQLRSVLKRYGSEIYHYHHKVHNNNTMGWNIKDTRSSAAYKSLMESTGEFNKNQVNLICTMFSDGARLKRLSRREGTSLLLRLEGLDRLSKSDESNMILCNLNVSHGGVSKTNLDNFFRRSLEELANLSVDVVVDIGKGKSEELTFKFQYLAYIADMKECRHITGIPNWNALNGCAVCLTEGVKTSRGFAYSSLTKFDDRKNDETLQNAIDGVKGFSQSGKPFVYSYIQPTKFNLDIFHTVHLGIVSYLLSQLVKPDKWKSAKLRNGRLEELDEASRSYVPYTHATSKHPSLLKKSMATGMETLKLAQVVLPLTAAMNDFESPSFGAFALGWYFVLSNFDEITQLDNVQKLLEFLHLLHNEIESAHHPLKHHVAYKHLINFVKTFGVGVSTEPFEKVHKCLQLVSNPNATNCIEELTTRFVLKGILRRDLAQGFQSELFKEYFSERSEPKISSDSTNNRIPLSDISEEHKMLIVRTFGSLGDTVFLKRWLLKKGDNNYIISSSAHWTPKLSDSSTVSYVEEQTGFNTFGKINLIFIHSGNLYCIIQNFVTSDFLSTFEKLIKRTTSHTANMVLRKCESFPSLFAKIVDMRVLIIPLDRVLYPAVRITYGNVNFVKKY